MLISFIAVTKGQPPQPISGVKGCEGSLCVLIDILERGTQSSLLVMFLFNTVITDWSDVIMILHRLSVLWEWGCLGFFIWCASGWCKTPQDVNAVPAKHAAETSSCTVTGLGGEVHFEIWSLLHFEPACGLQRASARPCLNQPGHQM